MDLRLGIELVLVYVSTKVCVSVYSYKLAQRIKKTLRVAHENEKC